MRKHFVIAQLRQSQLLDCSGKIEWIRKMEDGQTKMQPKKGFTGKVIFPNFLWQFSDSATTTCLAPTACTCFVHNLLNHLSETEIVMKPHLNPSLIKIFVSNHLLLASKQWQNALETAIFSSNSSISRTPQNGPS